MKAMLVSVGVGSGVDSGIAVSIKTQNPDRVGFLASEASLATIDQVYERLGNPASIGAVGTRLVEVVRNQEDLDLCYECARSIAQRLLQWGSPDDAVADFTSGTKAMSVAVSLVAVQMGFRALSYVGGRRRDPGTGRVLSGFEQVHTAQPFAADYDRSLVTAARLFDLCQFAACERVIEQYAARLDGSMIREMLALRSMAQFYRRWDLFDHKGASGLASDLKDVDDVLGIDTRANRELVCRLANTTDPSDCDRPDIAADLFENAQRRARESKFDDAVARLYRLVEHLAHQALKARFDQDASNVDRQWLASRKLLDKYGKHSDGNSRIRLGLRESYSLLQDLADPLADAYGEDNDLQKLLAARNYSILAHGIRPVGEEVFEKLCDHAARLCAAAYPGDRFEHTLAKCRFPELQSSTVAA